MLPHYQNCKILVIGDVMLDRYLHGVTDRISPEAPVPVVHINEITNKAGGAANVAFNLRSLGVEVGLAGIVGKDPEAQILSEILEESQVKTLFEYNKDVPTITKKRVLSQNQQLLRLDREQIFEEAHILPFYDRIIEEIPHYQLVILSDYGKGTLAQSQVIIDFCNQINCPILVDPKGRDFTKYRNASYITPNRKEFEAVVGSCLSEDDFQEKGLKLIHDLGLQGLLITRGAQGMTLIRENHAPFHLATEAKEVYDVTGAGDTVIATLAAGLTAQVSIEDAVKQANFAAGIVVGKVGTATVSPSELRRAIYFAHHNIRGVFNTEQLLTHVEDAKNHKETIVFTNGCFDILHEGHISYLIEAKKLGDRLIVAVNDDETVKRLKGSDRPINSLQRRMKLLAALEAVDWVVPFYEDTPIELINKIKPDILVKGGDYDKTQIVGAELVESWGGKVCSLCFIDGVSSTKIIEEINNRNKK